MGAPNLAVDRAEAAQTEPRSISVLSLTKVGVVFTISVTLLLALCGPDAHGDMISYPGPMIRSAGRFFHVLLFGLRPMELFTVVGGLLAILECVFIIGLVTIKRKYGVDSGDAPAYENPGPSV